MNWGDVAILLLIPAIDTWGGSLWYPWWFRAGLRMGRVIHRFPFGGWLPNTHRLAYFAGRLDGRTPDARTLYFRERSSWLLLLNGWHGETVLREGTLVANLRLSFGVLAFYPVIFLLPAPMPFKIVLWVGCLFKETYYYRQTQKGIRDLMSYCQKFCD